MKKIVKREVTEITCDYCKSVATNGVIKCNVCGMDLCVDCGTIIVLASKKTHDLMKIYPIYQMYQRIYPVPPGVPVLTPISLVVCPEEYNRSLIELYRKGLKDSEEMAKRHGSSHTH